MDIRELRIGSLVNYAFFIEPIQITGITEYYISYKEEGKEFTYTIDNFKHIPLTEEILLKAGFEKHSKDEFKHPKSDLLLYKGEKKWEVFLFEPIVEDRYLLHIEFLHHLQNIFFDLTGEELEIKL